LPSLFSRWRVACRTVHLAGGVVGFVQNCAWGVRATEVRVHAGSCDQGAFAIVHHRVTASLATAERVSPWTSGVLGVQDAAWRGRNHDVAGMPRYSARCLPPLHPRVQPCFARVPSNQETCLTPTIAVWRTLWCATCNKHPTRKQRRYAV